MFLNRLGVRQVNDVTANAAAATTAAIDPNGMGMLMGEGVNAAADALCGKRKECEDIVIAERRMLVNSTEAATERGLFENRTKHAQDLADIALKVNMDKNKTNQVDAATAKEAAATEKEAGEERNRLQKDAGEERNRLQKEVATTEKEAGEERNKLQKEMNNEAAEHAERMANIAQRMHDIKHGAPTASNSSGGAPVDPGLEARHAALENEHRASLERHKAEQAQMRHKLLWLEKQDEIARNAQVPVRVKKAPANAWCKKDHPEIPPNVYKVTVRGSVEFRWKKNKNNVRYASHTGFDTIEEAVASMNAHFDSAETQEQLANNKAGMDKSHMVGTVRVYPHGYGLPVSQ